MLRLFFSLIFLSYSRSSFNQKAAFFNVTLKELHPITIIQTYDN